MRAPRDRAKLVHPPGRLIQPPCRLTQPPLMLLEKRKGLNHCCLSHSGCVASSSSDSGPPGSAAATDDGLHISVREACFLARCAYQLLDDGVFVHFFGDPVFQPRRHHQIIRKIAPRPRPHSTASGKNPWTTAPLLLLSATIIRGLGRWPLAEHPTTIAWDHRVFGRPVALTAIERPAFLGGKAPALLTPPVASLAAAAAAVVVEVASVAAAGAEAALEAVAVVVAAAGAAGFAPATRHAAAPRRDPNQLAALGPTRGVARVARKWRAAQAAIGTPTHLPRRPGCVGIPHSHTARRPCTSTHDTRSTPACGTANPSVTIREHVCSLSSDFHLLRIALGYDYALLHQGRTLPPHCAVQGRWCQPEGPEMAAVARRAPQASRCRETDQCETRRAATGTGNHGSGSPQSCPDPCENIGPSVPRSALSRLNL